MADVTNTQDAPNLEDFNGVPNPATDPANPAPAASDPKPAETDPKPAEKDPKPADPKPAEGGADPKPANTEDVYAFLDTMTVEGVTQDKEAVKAFKELAKANNLTPEAAKAVAQFQLDAAKKQSDAFKDLQKAWAEEAQKTYGDNLKNVETNCSRVLAELDKDGKFKELLALVGAEKHPATLGFLKAVGEKTLEKPAVNPNATVSGEEHEPELEDFN